MPSHAAALLTLCAVITIAGCEKPAGFQNLVAVKGTVTLDGAPLPYGTVGFAPTAPDGQPAIGKIVNGVFTMLTTVDAPGVVAGTYKVRIEAIELVREMPAAPNPGEKPAKPDNLVPEKYGNIETSELEVEVAPGMADLTFDLES